MERKTERKIAGLLRIGLVAVVILLQLLLLMMLVRSMRQNAVYLYIIIEFVAIINIFILASKNQDSAYTIAWMLVIMFLPVFGHLLYILWGRSDTQGTQHKRTRESISYGDQFLERKHEIYAALIEGHPSRKRIAGYLGRKGFPLYQNTKCDYFPLGELQFDAMIADMKKAEHFIFIQYFILDTGKLWDRISDVLTRKAREGVEVRLMFDDLGSITTVPDNLLRELRRQGIQVVRYAPVHRFISRLFINYRNHQKITVIDGNIGYTGGTNLADEYANYYPKHGHWKDNAIRMKGDAVWSLTVTYLQMWDAETRSRSDYEVYRPTINVTGEGFFQPFADGPVNNPDNPAEVMYRNMVTNAREYVYITTPYLVIDNTMRDLLCTAAIAGVDVRIITPKIWDHWYVHAVTRSNYRMLLEAGVRIYEYTPGYIHAKTILSDDDHCVTGSINMDHRSFHLHFENGVWICGAPVLEEIKQDILSTFPLCEEIQLEEWSGRPLYVRMLEGILRVFAVML